MSMARAQPRARNNIYTVLVVVAFVALCVGIAAVVVRSQQLFDTGNPFKVVSTGVR
jgi:hypothetical protein